MKKSSKNVVVSHVQATARWDVGTPIHNDSDIVYDVYWQPVIAWVVVTETIDPYHMITMIDPVSVDSIGSNDRYVLRDPTGVIRSFDGGTMEDDSEVIERWKDEDDYKKNP